MAETTCSIAEARDRFAALVRDAEETNQPVQVTRRGQPVAVILSAEEYARLIEQQPQQNFWQAYLAFKEKWQDVPMDIEDDIWEGVRDKTASTGEKPMALTYLVDTNVIPELENLQADENVAVQLQKPLE